MIEAVALAADGWWMGRVLRVLGWMGGRSAPLIATAALVAVVLGAAGAWFAHHGSTHAVTRREVGAQTLFNRPTDVVQISAGGYHACGLRSSGVVLCWGSGWMGELGNDVLYHDSGTPVRVVGLHDAVAVAAGFEHTCAIRKGGSVLCWGANGHGELGDGRRSYLSDPVAVVGLHDAVSISAASMDTCVVRTGGRVACWGARVALGRQGFPGGSPRPEVVPGLHDVRSISVGDAHVCALRVTGHVVCWGYNFDGELGDGTTRNSNTPTAVRGVDDAIAVTVGRVHTCILRRDGRVSCFGSDEYGQLGDGRGADGRHSSTPVAVLGLRHVVAISAGEDHTCAVRASGDMRCWGYGISGVMGTGSELDSTSVPLAVRRLRDVRAISGGQEFQCALRAHGSVNCWGENGADELGVGPEPDDWGPTLFAPDEAVHFPDTGT